MASGIAACVFLLFQSTAYAASTTHAFNIPAQTLDDALNAFSVSAHTQILFDGSVAKGLRSHALTGSYSNAAGLKVLLKDTGLIFEILESGVILVQKAAVQGGQTQSSASRHVPRQTTPETETIVTVTGSRLVGSGFGSTMPIGVVRSDDIRRSGNLNIERTLNQIPQTIGSLRGNSTSNVVPNGGYVDINLRGLGSNRNLVLVNGRRFAIFDASGITDLNTIPATLVDRVEVVTGGSSAVYGSDAISGVVNFVLRNDFQGVETRAQVNYDKDSGTKIYSLDVTAGRNFGGGRGNVVVSANRLSREGLLRGQVGWAFDTFVDGCILAGSGSATHVGTYLPVPVGQTCSSVGGAPGFFAGGTGDIPYGRFSGLPVYDAANPSLKAAYVAAGLAQMTSRGFTFNKAGTVARPAISPQDDYNNGPVNYLVQPQDRWTVNVFAHFDIKDWAAPYTELHISHNLVTGQFAPSNPSVPMLYEVNNPYLSPQMQAVMRQLDATESGPSVVQVGAGSVTTTPGDSLVVLSTGRRLVELGNRIGVDDRNVFRSVLGVRGNLPAISTTVLTNLRYDAYFSYAKAQDTLSLFHGLSKTRYQAAILSTPGRAPLCDLFGQNLTPACLLAISENAENNTVATMQNVQATLVGDLFETVAGPVGFSVGVEWRTMSVDFRPDAKLSSGDMAGFDPGQPTKGSVTAKEVFGEWQIPLMPRTAKTGAISMNTGFRYSDYDLTGLHGVWSYFGGAKWQPNSDYTFRTQYQRAIRAPNLNELFGGLVRSAVSLIDPCSSRSNIAARTAAVASTCVATGMPANLVFTDAVQPNTTMLADFGGNPNLREERANTLTAGVVFTPTAIPHLVGSIDYFRINIDGAIAPLGGGAQNTLDLCYYSVQRADSAYCAAIHRDPYSGAITDPYAVSVLNANTGSLTTSGVDFALKYRAEAGPGLFGLKDRSYFELAVNYTYMREFTMVPVSQLGIVNQCVGAFGTNCGQPLPRFKGITSLNWHSGPMSASARMRYIASVATDRYLLPKRQGSALTPALSSLAYPVLPSRQYIDLSFNYRITDRLDLSIGVINVFGTKPPLTSQGPTSNTFTATYDAEGPQLFLGITARY